MSLSRFSKNKLNLKSLLNNKKSKKRIIFPFQITFSMKGHGLARNNDIFYTLFT